jgi:hypothetical protein
VSEARTAFFMYDFCAYSETLDSADFHDPQLKRGTVRLFSNKKPHVVHHYSYYPTAELTG